MAAVAAVAVVAVTAGCGGDGGSKGPKDEMYACVTAVGDSKNYSSNLSTQILAARNTGGTSTHVQAMANAQSLANDWLVKIKDLVGKEISSELRQTLTESQASIEAIQKTLADANGNPPDASGKLSAIDGNINRACKGKY